MVGFGFTVLGLGFNIGHDPELALLWGFLIGQIFVLGEDFVFLRALGGRINFKPLNPKPLNL